MLLHETSPVVGLWRLVGEGPRSALISFKFAQDGIEGSELECRRPLSGKVDATPWARVCPARGLTTTVAVDADGSHATVTVYGAQGHRIHKSPSAEAAAAVALPHSQVSAARWGWERLQAALAMLSKACGPPPAAAHCGAGGRVPLPRRPQAGQQLAAGHLPHRLL